MKGSTVSTLLLSLLVLLLPSAPTRSQEPAAETEREAPAAEEEPTGAEPAAVAAPFDPEAATEAYLSRISPEEKERSDSYFEGRYWLRLWGFLYGLAVAWLLLASGLSARMRGLAERITRRSPLRTAIYVLQYLVAVTVLVFPLTLYRDFFREHQYDLATQTFGPWMRDQLVGLGVSLVLTPLLLIPLYGVIRKAPRTWWLWGSVVAIAFLIFVVLIAPVYIDPLYRTYEPLADERVREPILSMARANGIEVDDVYQFDASRQTTRISANVSGFLGTMRIRLNDNLLERCTLAEIEAVMGHEIGHFALNHMYELLVYLGLLLVAGIAFVSWSFERVRERWGGRWGVRGIGDVAGFPLLAALLSVFFFAATPVFNNIIRTNEAEADLFSLNAARQPDGFAEVALKLAEYRKLDPTPLEEWFFFDHPSGRSRISMAMRWKAEQQN